MEFDKPHFVYGINNCYDLFLKLHREGEKVGENWHPYDCFNFFVSAWHLYDDWIQTDINRPKLALEKIGRTAQSMKNLLLAIKDLTNGSKHMILKPNNFKKTVITCVYSHIIGDWRAYFMNEPQLYIAVGETYYSMWDIRCLIINYFTWIFDDSLPANHFPKEIEKHLESCLLP